MAKMEIDLQDVLEDLSYSWATPEAEHFFALVGENDLAAARKILKENLNSNEEVEAVMAHYIAQVNQKYTLEEISVEDVPLIDDDAPYMINYNGTISSSSLYEENGHWFFYANRGSVHISEVKQVWKVIKQ